MSKVILSEITTLGEKSTLRVSPGSKIDLTRTNSYLQLPKGSTEQRPESASSGELRYNTDTKLVEYYDGTQWQEIEYPEDYNDITKAGLVLHLDASSEESYPGSGNNWYDLTSYGNNGTLVNGTTYIENDKVMDFDGDNDFVTLTSPTNFDGEFSYGCWVRRDVVSGNGYTNMFTSTLQNEQLQLDTTGFPGSMGMYVNGAYSRTESNVIPIGVWTYCVWQRTGTTLNGWVNGVRVFNGENNLTYSSVSTAQSRVNKLGAYSSGTSYNLNGALSNVQIYNRALTPGEIWKNYAALAPRFGIDPIPSIVTSGLVMHLDAANYQSYPRSGNTWYDLSGNGNHVTMDASLVPTFERNSVFRVNNGANFETTSANISLNQITMIAWYKAITRGGGFSTRVLETHKTGATISNSHALAPDGDGTLRAWVESGNSTAGNRISSTDATEVYPLNEWIMMAYTHDGSNGRLYVNGKNTLTVAGSASVLDDINIITIGAISDANTYQHNQYYMDAEISTAMIYTRALSAAEIQQNFNAHRTRYGI
jgi:hypothetical protein